MFYVLIINPTPSIILHHITSHPHPLQCKAYTNGCRTLYPTIRPPSSPHLQGIMPTPILLHPITSPPPHTSHHTRPLHYRAYVVAPSSLTPYIVLHPNVTPHHPLLPTTVHPFPESSLVQPIHHPPSNQPSKL